VPYISQGKLYLGQVLCKGLQQDEAQDCWQHDQQEKPKNSEFDSHAIGKDDVSITSPSTSLGTLDSISTVTAMVTLHHGFYIHCVSHQWNVAQLCLDLHKKVNDLG
jgi:hypothetical protein